MMEVHHSNHPGPKKKWHEYLLEFLMLFLAEFLGFLVENFREHKVEKLSERELTMHRYNYRLRDCQKAAEDLMLHIKTVYHIQ